MRVLRSLSLSAVASVALAVGSVTAQEAPLTLSLDEAVELARLNNPGFQTARNDLDVADWNVRSAWASLLPTASASGGLGWQGPGEQRFGSLTASDLGFVDQPSYYSSSFSVGVNYRLDGTTLLAPGQARAARRGTEAQIRTAAVDLDRRVTTAYLEVLRQREQVELGRLQLERARFNLRLAEGQRDVGRVTAIDVQQAAVQVGRSEVTLLQSEQGLRTAQLRLLQTMGVSLDRELTLTSEFGLAEPDLDEGRLYALALERNPTLAARRSNHSVSVYDVRMAKSNYYPSLSVSTGISGFTQEPSSTDFLVQQARSQVASQISQCQATNDLYSRLADPLPPLDCSRFVFTDADRQQIISANDRFPFDFIRSAPSVSLSVSIPIFQGLGRQQQLESAQAAREDAEQQVREQELALEADIAVGVGSVRTAYQSALIEQRNQELADEQLRLAREQYRVGMIPFVDLLDAETVKAEADQALLAAVYGFHDAITELEAIVGVDLRPDGP